VKSAATDAEIVVADISKLPFFNPDLVNESPDEVAKFKAAIEGADAVLFVTPEYNYSISGVLKNAIDVGARWGKNSFAGKPVGLVSVAYSFLGGLRAQATLRQIFINLNVAVCPAPELAIGDAYKKFDNETGDLKDADTQSSARAYTDGLVKFAQVHAHKVH